MYNYMRRCLIISITSQRKFFTQSSHDGIAALSKIACCASARGLRNNATCKRFYCQVAIDEAHKQTDAKCDSQQKLNEFLSTPENKKIFQILELEVDVMRHNAEKVPDNINSHEWLTILHMSTRSQRKKYLSYLWRNEKSDINKRTKKEEKKAEWLAKKAEAEQAEDTDTLKYGLLHNSMFLRIYQKSINHYYNCKLIQAMMFEPKIVFDCGYDGHMTTFENHNCAKQLTLAFAANRAHVSPMCIYYCNLKEGQLMNNFKRNMPNIFDDDFPAVVTSQSYLDLFPKDQLLYLTPHCRTDLTEYDPDMVYIIGAMVDKSSPKPLSLAKAKKEGLRMAKLPIEKYLDWGSGSTKNLTLNQMLNILLDINITRNWKEALRHVPTRKLREAREYMLKKKLYKELNSKEAPFEEAETKKFFAPTDSFTFTSRRNR